MRLPLRLPQPPPGNGEVVLRDFSERDVAMLIELSRDPYVPLIGSLPAHTDRAGALAYLERQRDRLEAGTGFPFCVALRHGDEAVGIAGLWLGALEEGRASGGYCIAAPFRGRGCARQALRALTAFAWSMPELHRVELYVEPWNTASASVAEAAGYQREGVPRSHQVIGGRRVDMVLYAALRPWPDE